MRSGRFTQGVEPPEQLELDAAYDALLDTYIMLGSRCVAYFNDTHSHAEVLAMFDKAIEMYAKQEGR